VELDLGKIRTDTEFTTIIRLDTRVQGEYKLIVTNPDSRSHITLTIIGGLQKTEFGLQLN
jgi:hypothetical protein